MPMPACFGHVRIDSSTDADAHVDHPIRPPHPEAPASAGLEGGLQNPARELAPSFEASASLRRLRMRILPG
ncbi:hypothetical protein FV220_21445 [Methylobacterium sp. WL19]|nr:hypothetical protein FV220_21445 [Methylobacterium sp. WL19]